METKTIILRARLDKNRLPVLIDADLYEQINAFKWNLGHNGYAIQNIHEGSAGNKIHYYIYMHRLVLPPKEGVVIDHINRNKLDNRRANLRYTTQSLNTLNSNMRTNNTSGYPGVYYRNERSKWAAYIRIHGEKRTHLGMFNTYEEAVAARQAVEREVLP